MTTETRIAVVEGLGFKWLDFTGGQLLTIQRLKARKINTGGSPYHYSDGQRIIDFLKGTSGFRGGIGDSFGADYLPQYAEQSGLAINGIWGFQPSSHSSNAQTVRDNNGTHSVIWIPKNVIFAHCVRDPVWADTAGLGWAEYWARNPKLSRVLVTLHRAAHPDDFGVMEDLVFHEVMHRVEVYNEQHKPSPGPSGH